MHQSALVVVTLFICGIIVESHDHVAKTVQGGPQGPCLDCKFHQGTMSKNRKIVRRSPSQIHVGNVISTASNNNYGTQVGIAYESGVAETEHVVDNILTSNRNVNYGEQAGILYSDHQPNDPTYAFVCKGNSTNNVFIQSVDQLIKTDYNENHGLQEQIIFNNQGGGKKPLGYYWREYNGVIPKDALPTGKDSSGRDTYTGQAYVNQNGLFIGEIIPGKKQVEFQSYGVVVVDSGIRILCTKYKERFRWLRTSKTTFHSDTASKHVVVGGHNQKEPKCLYIGRAHVDSALRIGAVAPFEYGNAILYFVNNGNQEDRDDYEVLVYDE